jgi:peptide/nickel transport system permease protein
MSEVAAVGPVRQSLLMRVAWGVRRDPLLVLCSCICAVLVFVVLFGPLLAPYPPNQISILAVNQGVSGSHWLGTDDLGRDILSRLLYGARPSLVGAAFVVVFATSFGTFLAIVSVWYGGWVDRGIMRFANVLFAIPSILIAIVGVAILGPGLTAPVLALSVAYSPYFARIGRAAALPEREKPYIEACSLAGLSARRICFFHLLPNIGPIVLAQATINLGFALMDLAAISFIGLGVQLPGADWGVMISEGRSSLLNGHPMEALAAGTVIVVSVVAVMVLGERLAARAKSDA